MRKNLFKTKIPSVQFNKLFNVFDMVVFHRESSLDLKIPSLLDELVINKGEVWLDGEKIQHPRFGPNSLNWTQQTADAYSSGVLHFSMDGMAFMGSIHKGKTAVDAEPIHCSGVTAPTIYETKITLDGTEQVGLNFKLGYKHSSTGGFPESIRELGSDDDDYQDIVGISNMKVDPKDNRLILGMDFNLDAADAGCNLFGDIWPASFNVELSWDGESFSGDMRKFDSQKSAPQSDTCAWSGNATQHSNLVRMQVASLLGTRPQKALLDDSAQLSIGDLMTISPDGVRDLANEMLMENMKYAMSDDWRTNLMGSEKPVLSQQRKTQLNEAKSFYTDKFAPAYLTWGLGASDSPGITVKLNDQQKKKLKYYLHNGLAKEEGYNAQSNMLFVDAFIESSPKLQKYINDKSTDWGQKLYDTLTTDAQINQVVSIIIATQSMQVPNRYATLIACFPGKSDLAIEYNKTLVSALMMHVSSNYDANDKSQIMEWLPDFIEQFILAFEHEPSNPDQQAEMARWAQAQALKEAADALGGILKLADAMANCIATAGGASFYSKADGAKELFIQAHPKFSNVASFLRVAVLAGGVYSSVQGFMKWKELDTKGKIELIVTTVDLVGNLILAVPDFIKVTRMSISGIVKVSRWFASTRVGRLLSAGMDRLASWLPETPNWLTRIASRIGEFFDAVKKTIEDAAKFMSKLFRGFAKFMRFFGVAVAGAFAVLSTITFVKDLINNAPTVQATFDGLIAGTGIMETVCLVVDLVVVTEVFAVAAAALAVLGIIFVIVEMLIPKPKPESPMDKFLKETGIPFISGLEDPPSDWDGDNSNALRGLMQCA